MHADYVIVGAGSAGCVLANRLTEDPRTTVILIEAGGRDTNPLIHIPAGYMKLLDHPKLTWGFRTAPDGGINGRSIAYPRGRVLGGSSSINGMIYIRSQPEDYDYWSQLGNRGWSWDDVRPYFDKAENWSGPTTDSHGKGGPLNTSEIADRPPLCQAAIDAAGEIGVPYRPDLNDLPHGLGDHIGWIQQTRRGRRRFSAAVSYLHPVMKRPNLLVITDALVHRVVFEGNKATGVEFSRGGRIERAGAAGEVVLSAGAIGSPHILQLSGVGDPDHLQRVGIPVHRALRGVGKNFQDHFIVRVAARVAGARSLNERSRGLGLAGEVLRYVLTGKGMLTYGASLLAASVKVLEESATPDIQAMFAPGSYGPGPVRKLDRTPGMTGGIWQMRPESRGYVEARTNDPRDQPAINPRFLDDERDRRSVVGGLRFLRRLFAAPALAKYVVAETEPGAGVQSDDELLEYARRSGTTVFHASCSCRMGPDPMSVVDDRLRVHGLQGLRVIDASVMPAVTSTNTNAPTIMIAEKGAAMVRQAARSMDTARSPAISP